MFEQEYVKWYVDFHKEHKQLVLKFLDLFASYSPPRVFKFYRYQLRRPNAETRTGNIYLCV